MPTNELVSGAEIGRRIGRTKQRVSQLVQREDFPEHVDQFGQAKVYRSDDVAKWCAEHGYTYKLPAAA